MKFNSQFCLLVLSMILLSTVFVSAEVNEYAPVLKDDCVVLSQVCASCTGVNISVKYPAPNSSYAVYEEVMNRTGSGDWFYEFCNTSLVGRYDVTGHGDLSGVDTGFDVLWFEVTPSGSLMRDGDSLVLFGSLIVMIIISSMFLFLATKLENLAAKTTLFAIAFIGYLMSVLYTVVTIQQVLFGFDSIMNGIETFLFVGKIGVFLGFITLMIVIFLIMLKAWKIRRGLDD